MTAIYEATKPAAIDFDHICDRCPKFNKVIALLQDLSHSGLLALARAITEELAVIKQGSMGISGRYLEENASNAC